MNRESLVLHHCCAPCSPGIVRALGERYALTGFWFNPNIQPLDEYEKRRAALVEYIVTHLKLPLFFGPDMPQDEWLRSAGRTKPERCRFCYTLRLTETARFARQQGGASFSTTLLASPYQQHEMIAEIGRAVAERERVRFVYIDGRERYYAGKQEARELGLYSQRYCGCLHSLEERMAEKKKVGP